jgi:hypothetical protein
MRVSVESKFVTDAHKIEYPRFPTRTDASSLLSPQCREPPTTGIYYTHICNCGINIVFTRYLTVFSPEGRLYQVGSSHSSIPSPGQVLIKPRRIRLQSHLRLRSHIRLSTGERHSSGNHTEETPRQAPRRGHRHPSLPTYTPYRMRHDWSLR